MSQKRPLLTTNNRLTTHSKNLPQTDTVKRLKALLDDTANGNDRKTRPKKRRVDAPSNTVRPDKLPRSAMEEANVNACSSTSATQDNRSRTSATAPISQRWSCLSRKLKPQTPGVNKVDVWGGQPATSTSVTNNKQVPLFSVRKKKRTPVRKPPVKPVCVHSKVNDAVSVCLHVKHDNQSVTRAVMDPPVLSASRKATDSIAAAVPILRRKLGLQVIRTKQRTVIGRMNSEKSYSVPLMEGPLTIEKAAASIVDKTATNSSSSTFHAAASPAIKPLDAVGTERTKSASGDLEHDGINNKEDPKDDELVLDDPANLKGPHTTTFSKPDDPSIRSTPLDSRATSSLAASQPMPRPTRDGLTTTTLKSKQQKGDQGNFVRLNLRNGAGSCRGALPKKTKSKAALQWEQRRKNRDEFYASNRGEHDDTQTTQSYATKPRHDASTMTQHSSGTDPLDDYIDGVYHPQHQKVAADHRHQEASNGPAIPNCSHGRPCKRLTVKKASVNKGRVFFACSLPRAEQCDCFIWADDTVQAAQQALLRNQSCSGFVARQVASYMESMKIMTVPELQRLAARKGLNSTGKKQALLARLSIWVRDEVAVSVAEEQSNENASVPIDPTELEKATGVYAESGNLESETTLPDKLDVVVEADFSTKCVNEAAQRVPREMLLKDSLNLKNSEGGCVMPLLERRQGLRLPEIVDDEVSLDESSDDEMELCEPTLQLQNSSSNSCPLHLALKAMFGHDSFRESQEWTVRRCLDKKRTLLVAPTGFGKSLCYALPASLMKGVCIVVSPLISLIQDQLRVLPPRLPAATMSGAVTSAKLAATLDDIIRGRIRILFVSPERLTSASFRRLFRPIWNTDTREHERKFPPVSLLCVDEAHCLSQWAHNFRPSYLRLKSMVNMIQPESVLAITATAGPKVVTDICRTLNIDKNTSEEADNGVRVMKCNRDNIDVRCLLLTSQTERLKKVIKILTPKKKRTSNKSVAPEVSDDGCLATGNVIVYVWRQLDAQAVAENLQAAGIEGGIVIYHGGMDASARSKAQSKFMRGKARICVATVAFGLGINKEDVTGVIHMYLSASPEHYMQEIGRAGRDGRSAVAFALVLEDEILVRHSLAHSDLIAKSQVKALLSSLIGEVEDGKRLLPADRSTADPISVGLPLHKAVVECGAKSETVETLVSLLEQRTSGVPLLQIEGVFYDCAFVAPKRRSMKDLAVKECIAGAILRVATCTEPPAGEAVDLSIEREKAFPGCRKMVGYSYGSYAFSVAKCANLLGSSAEPRHVFAALRRLESNGEIELALDKSINSQALNIRLTHEGMMTFRSDNCIGVNEIVSELFSRFIATVELSTTKVLDMHYIFQKVGAVSQVGSTHFLGENEKKSRSLVLFQELTRNYLEAEGLGQSLNDRSDDQSSFTQSIHKAKLWSDVRAVLGSLHDMLAASSRRPLVEINDPHAADYAALSTTKFLHGIAPATLAPRLLRTHPLFGSMQAVRFTVLHEAVSDIAAPQTKGDSGS